MAARSPASPLDSALIARFAAIVGPRFALTEPEAIRPFLAEPRDLFHASTPLVLRPGSTEEVAAILRLADETATAIVPQGGNTGLVGGQVPLSGREVVVSLSRLDRVRAVDAEGNTMTLEAGVTLARAQQVAEAADRLFPLSLASEGSCQIGGNLSTNAGGTAVLAYGNARDLTLGLEVVLPDGGIWNGLRGLRKDNTGYDLRDLFIGSEGTLGIITAAVLKLFPRPAGRATAFVGLADPHAALSLFNRARDAAGPALTSFELIARIGLDFLLAHLPGARDPLSDRHAWYALMEVSSGRSEEEARDTAEAILGAALDLGLVEDAALAASLAQAKEFWRLRESLSEIQKAEGGSIKHDVSVPVARVPDFLAAAAKAATGFMPGCRPVPFGHLGDGNIHFNISQPIGADKQAFLEQWEAMNAVVHAEVARFGGSISAEHGIGRLKRGLLVEVKAPLELELMRRVKAAFDPKNLLNPGKVL